MSSSCDVRRSPRTIRPLRAAIPSSCADDDPDDCDDDHARDRGEYRLARSEVERLTDCDDARDELPHTHEQRDDHVKARYRREDEEESRRLRESQRAEQLTPRRGAAEHLVADDVR